MPKKKKKKAHFLTSFLQKDILLPYNDLFLFWHNTIWKLSPEYQTMKKSWLNYIYIPEALTNDKLEREPICYLFPCYTRGQISEGSSTVVKVSLRLSILPRLLQVPVWWMCTKQYLLGTEGGWSTCCTAVRCLLTSLL